MSKTSLSTDEQRRLPTLAEAKAEATTRRKAATDGQALSHAAALEQVALGYGFRDWNALHAAIKHRRPEAWTPGGRVTGHYLGQAFSATVITATPEDAGWTKLALDLDEAVDVVTFESFSNLRKRIHATVGPLGHTKERTSDGVPHMTLGL